MLVELGPVPSAAVRAWINYARESLAAVRTDPREVPAGVIDSFAGYLNAWESAARADPVFRWSGEAAPEQIVYLAEWLYRLGLRIEDDAETGSARLRPPEADKFHGLLVRTFLQTLVRESPNHAAFVDEMQQRWKIARSGN